MTENRFNGGVAIVTGARQGLGRQLAVELAERGMDIVLAARGDASETLREVEAKGRSAVMVTGDLTADTDRVALIEAAIDRFGRIDALVNNAAYTSGPGMFESIDELSLHDWRRQFEINLDVPFDLSRLAAKHMRAAGGGVILNITSPAAVPRPIRNGEALPYVMIGYETTKAALERMTNSLATSWLPDRIAVVAYDPGLVATENTVATFQNMGLAPVDAAEPRDVARSAVDVMLTAQDHTGEVVRIYA